MFKTKLTAVIQCDNEAEHATGSANWGCVATETYEVDAEEVSLETFNSDAREHFRKHGWQMFGGTRCPHCKQFPYIIDQCQWKAMRVVIVVKQISDEHRRVEVTSRGRVYAMTYAAECDDALIDHDDMHRLWAKSRKEFMPFDESANFTLRVN